MQQRSQSIQLLIFAALWSLFIGAFLFVAVWGLRDQARTDAFKSVTGQIDSIEKTVSHSSKHGTSYGIKVSYHYTVNADMYHATRVRFGFTQSDESWADGMLARYHPGRPALVYYDPDNPAESVLLQGVDGGDYFVFLFLMPFVIVGGFLWYLVFRKQGASGQFQGLRVIDSGAVTRLRPHLTRPVWIAAIILGAGSFLSIFIVGFASPAGGPLASVTLTVMACLFLAAIAAALFYAARIVSGKRDVILDDDQRLLTLPGHRPIGYGDVSTIRIDGSSTTVNNRPLVYVRVYFRDLSKASGIADHYTVKWTSDEDQARQLAAFLALRLNVPANELGRPLLPQVNDT